MKRNESYWTQLDLLGDMEARCQTFHGKRRARLQVSGTEDTGPRTNNPPTVV